MKTIEDINLYTWFMDRELDFTPPHFVKSGTVLTDESKVWILEKLTGRFSITGSEGFFSNLVPSFEDPKEALFYELKWG
jgi:hypothetical protein